MASSPLVNALGAALNTIGMIDVVKINKRECAALAKHIENFTTVIRDNFQGLELSSDFTVDLEELEQSLASIVALLQKLPELPILIPLVQSDQISEQIKMHTIKLNHAMYACQLGKANTASSPLNALGAVLNMIGMVDVVKINKRKCAAFAKHIENITTVIRDNFQGLELSSDFTEDLEELEQSLAPIVALLQKLPELSIFGRIRERDQISEQIKMHTMKANHAVYVFQLGKANMTSTPLNALGVVLNMIGMVDVVKINKRKCAAFAKHIENITTVIRDNFHGLELSSYFTEDLEELEQSLAPIVALLQKLPELSIFGRIIERDQISEQIKMHTMKAKHAMYVFQLRSSSFNTVSNLNIHLSAGSTSTFRPLNPEDKMNRSNRSSIQNQNFDLADRIQKQSEYPVDGGGFADVFRGYLTHAEGTTQAVALKVLRLAIAPDNKLQKRIRREIKIWSRLDHRNILSFLGFSEKFGPKRLCMVSPWQANGHVMEYLKVHYTNDVEGHARVFALILGTAEGLAYLHAVSIVHGDLKGANVLISDDGSALLADFGLSRMCHDATSAEGSTTTTIAGSSRWMAPERLNPDAFGLTDSGANSYASDVFSFGMTIYQILSGDVPFANIRNSNAVGLAILRGERPPPIQYRTSVEHAAVLIPVMQQSYAHANADRPSASRCISLLQSNTSHLG